MINIISKSYLSKKTSGPKKVVENLIKGLDKIGYPYCINKSLDSTSQLWIHDDAKALRKASELGLKAVVGPNIYILPRNIHGDINLDNFLYIHPSKWAEEFWEDFGFDRCKLDFWPTGIDTEIFKERETPKDGEVLIYFKQRSEEELSFIKDKLKNKGIKFSVIKYGEYVEKDYIKKIKNSKYIIWLGRQESQGIALQEALSMNVPILVWDVKNVGDWVPRKNELHIFNEEELKYENTSSAYYFDGNCGIKFKDRKDFDEKLEIMEQNYTKLNPRKYIINNLNLKKQAIDFVNLFEEHLGIKYEDGLNEEIKNNKDWVNNSFYYRLIQNVKDLLR